MMTTTTRRTVCVVPGGILSTRAHAHIHRNAARKYWKAPESFSTRFCSLAEEPSVGFALACVGKSFSQTVFLLVRIDSHTLENSTHNPPLDESRVTVIPVRKAHLIYAATVIAVSAIIIILFVLE